MTGVLHVCDTVRTMSCDHDRLRTDPAAFEAGTRPVIRNGVQARQFGARMADCITCPPTTTPSTFMHPADAHLVEAFFDAEEAGVTHAA